MVFLPYIIIFCISAFFVFNPLSFKEKFNDKIILFFIFFLTLFVGSSLEIGGDWGIYLYNYYVNGENFDFFTQKLSYTALEKSKLCLEIDSP